MILKQAMASSPTSRLIAVLRVAGWLSERRARAWCIILALMTGLAAIGYVVTSKGGLDISGKPLGTDFVSFWTAADLALQGRAGSAYDPVLHEAAQRALFPEATNGYAAFFYPPTFLLLCLPLALLSYIPALALWLAAGFSALYTCLRSLLPQRWAILPILAFPGILTNLGHGQNGFVTAACFGWGMMLSRNRPFLAGMALGVLIIKPHLLIAAPIILLAARRWMMIAGGLTSGVLLLAMSWAILGNDAWRGFIDASPLARQTLEQGLVGPGKMQSVFSAARLMHGGLGLAYALQGLMALAAGILVARIARHRPDPMAELVLLVVATLLSTPFLLDYDLVCLALPLAWVAADAQRTGWFAWEKITLLMAYILPIVARPLATASGITVAPIVIATLLLVVVNRIRWRQTHRQLGASI